MLDAAGPAWVLDAAQGTSDWRAAHEALRRLARRRAGLDFEEGKWLLAAQRAGVHARLGYGSFFEYIERLFGYSPRLTHDKLRVAGALEGLPQLAQALREGAATWSSVRELTRVAIPETERAWLDAASGRTAHEVERFANAPRRREGVKRSKCQQLWRRWRAATRKSFRVWARPTAPTWVDTLTRVELRPLPKRPKPFRRR